jgi:hypothetical protein
MDSIEALRDRIKEVEEYFEYLKGLELENGVPHKYATFDAYVDAMPNSHLLHMLTKEHLWVDDGSRNPYEDLP